MTEEFMNETKKKRFVVPQARQIFSISYTNFCPKIPTDINFKNSSPESLAILWIPEILVWKKMLG
jgi:hypothetical protein